MHKLWRSAVHEAGHSVAAVVLDAPYFGGCQIYSTGGAGFNGRAYFHFFPKGEEGRVTLAEVRRRLEGALITGFCGGLAEEVCVKVKLIEAVAGCEKDMEHMRLAVADLVDVCGGTPEQHRKEGLRRARQLVARHRGQIIAVAEALLQRKRLTADEVREVMATAGGG